MAVILCAAALLAVLIFLTMPRIGKRRIKGLFSHRGLHNAEIPENSIEAVNRAVCAGVGIELDVRLTSDGVPVVVHDDFLKRLCGKEAYVSQTPYEELHTFRLLGTGYAIPRFKDVLDAVGGRVPLLIEIKTDGCGRAVCAAVYRLLDGYAGDYYIESFDPFALRIFKKNRPQIIRGQLAPGNGKTPVVSFFARHGGLLLTQFLTRPDFFAYEAESRHKLLFYFCKFAYRPGTAAWTITVSEQLKKLRGKYDAFIFEGFIPKG